MSKPKRVHGIGKKIDNLCKPCVLFLSKRKVTANHITLVSDKVVYIVEPGSDVAFIPLEERFSGYSYYWSKYLMDQQDSDHDIHEYSMAQSPMKTTGLRTFQGAGDIKGLMDIYDLLRHGFVSDDFIQSAEYSAFNLLEEIMTAQRDDNSFIFESYFGTALSSNLFPKALINDAEILQPTILPEGLRKFTGTMAVMEFLLVAREDIDFCVNVDINDRPEYQFLVDLRNRIDEVLKQLGDLLIRNIDITTRGIPKQSVIGYKLVDAEASEFFLAQDIKVTIDLSDVGIPASEIPEWIIYYDEATKHGISKVYQWDYLNLLDDLYLQNGDIRFIEPLLDSYREFYSDFKDDTQYQLSSICGGKDPFVRTFFIESFFPLEIA